MEEILHQLIYGFSHYLQVFYRSNRWLFGISEPSTVSQAAFASWEGRHPNLEILLMEEIPNNQLGCIKPCNEMYIMGYLPSHTISTFLPLTDIRIRAMLITA